MDSINNHLPSRLLCPAVRFQHLKSQYQKEIGDEKYEESIIVDNSYYISNFNDEESPHSHHLLPLIGCNNRETIANVRFSVGDEAYCGSCRNNTIGTTYYFCQECDKWYHKECVESPSMLNSPYHPKHSLQLRIFVDDGTSMMMRCRSCVTSYGCLYYYCSLCYFSLDPVCATKPPFIDHQKMHEHTLYYFPRRSVFTCDACGVDDDPSFIFVCLRCDFVVHKMCIYLPRIIKISRHKHRLSFELGTEVRNSLSSEQRFCGVCRKNIYENYGSYSCIIEGCIYVVHPKCATKRIVWDGKELEGEAEEVNEFIKPPFEKISDGTILHFSHSESPMRLVENVKTLYDENKFCQACMLPLYMGKAYICMRKECDFVLHEECAYLPRVIQHVLHVHSLTLEPSCKQTNRLCQLCFRDSFGFKYVCYNGCNKLSLDVRCASIPEEYKHHSHKHPLLVTNSTSGDTCSICNRQRRLATLNCDECRFVICFYCATLPYNMSYKNDEHLVTLSYDKTSNGIYWCDICEETIYTNTGFYRCNECEVTLHIECLLGVDLYIDPSSRVTILGNEFDIVQNNTFTRPICHGCRRRCQYKMMYISSSGDIYCSIKDIYTYVYKASDYRHYFLTLEPE